MEYSGTLLLVSHDREFLDNVVTSTLVLTGDGTVRESVGGYADWLRQAAAEAPVVSAAPKPAAERTKKTADRPRKLSFKEERELEALPERIAGMEEEQESLHRTLSDPDFYRNAGTEVATINARLELLDQELAGAYQRWEELENIRAGAEQ